MQINDKNLRKDFNVLFEKSGMFTGKELDHEFFIVIEGDDVSVKRNATDLLDISDCAVVITQWRGKYKSDLFVFTGADFKMSETAQNLTNKI
jgi:hypothetical protein